MRAISGNCNICGLWFEALDRDHIVAKRLGGTDDIKNIQYICPNCHRIKTRRDKELQAWRSGVAKKNWERGVYKDNRPMQGKTHLEEARAKISAAHRGRKLTEEWRLKISESGIGRTVSEETRAKISASHKGKPKSEEHRAAIKLAKNLPMSEETHKKMSDAAKARHAAGIYKVTLENRIARAEEKLAKLRAEAK